VGCDNAQGYFYARPVHPERIPALVREIPLRFHHPGTNLWLDFLPTINGDR
jgi:hypothetical protein